MGDSGFRTLLLTAGIASFLPSPLQAQESWEMMFGLRQAVWELRGAVLLFDLYGTHQQLQIQRNRRQLTERGELFRPINENAADMITMVDPRGRRIYNSISYVTRDFSERKRAVEVSLLSEASFRCVVEDAPYGIYRAGIPGRFLRVNPALQRMLGYATGDQLLDARLDTAVFRNSGSISPRSLKISVLAASFAVAA